MAQSTGNEGAGNPYQAPKPEPQPEGMGTASIRSMFAPRETETPEAIRATYIAHEATVKTIGLTMYVKGVFSLLGIVTMLLAPRSVEAIVAKAGGQAISPDGMKVILVVTGALGAGFSFLIGAQLRRFKNWARWTIIVLHGISIVGTGVTLGSLFQLGFVVSGLLAAVSVLINVYILYVLLMSEDGTLFSREYREVISRTPQLRPGTRVRDPLLLFVTALVYAAGLVAQLFGVS